MLHMIDGLGFRVKGLGRDFHLIPKGMSAFPCVPRGRKGGSHRDARRAKATLKRAIT